MKSIIRLTELGDQWLAKMTKYTNTVVKEYDESTKHDPR